MIENAKWQLRYLVERGRILFQKDMLTVENGPLLVLEGNVRTDPHDVSLNLYLVLSEMGYPLEIRKGAKTASGRPIIGGMQRTLTDSLTTKKKIVAFFGQPSDLSPASEEGSGYYSHETSFFSYDTTHIIEASEYGGTRTLRALLEGNEAVFYDNPNNISIHYRTPNDAEKQLLIQRCFMRAHEVALKMNEPESNSPDYRRQRFADEMKNQPLYEELRASGIQRIDPPGIREVIRTNVRDILARNPQLLP